MPRLNDNLDNFKLPTGNYGFSAQKLSDLGAAEYTLVTLIVDKSGSVAGFRDQIVEAIKTVVNACKYSPRADNLMLRVVAFDDKLEELHGFKLLANVNVDDYNSFVVKGGMTALYDSAENGITATIEYGKQLTASDFSANAIVFVITDGEDNRSAYSPSQVRQALEKGVKGECLESLVSVLIGVNVTDPGVKNYLDNFHKEAGFTQYVDAGAATPQKLAKLAEFVSKSISAQSQALGTGGPSQSLKF